MTHAYVVNLITLNGEITPHLFINFLYEMIILYKMDEI